MFFAPAAFAAIVIGSVLFGALTGHVVTNSQPAAATYVAQPPACYFHHTASGHLVKVCD